MHTATQTQTVLTQDVNNLTVDDITAIVAEAKAEAAVGKPRIRNRRRL